jgi:hypothetical protein
MPFALSAYVTAILNAADAGFAFVLGDGRVRFEDGREVEAHDGAALAATAHPSGQGVVTGGDDGRLVWTRPEGAQALAEHPGAWIDAVASSRDSGLIAYALGKRAVVLAPAEPDFQRTFDHPATVADLAFDPRGRRLAAATYGGVALWYARFADQKPVTLRWAGSHARALFSPDGKYLVSAMQEPALHAWRLADGAQAELGGCYGGKVRSLAFVQKGDWLATSGADQGVIWPFLGRDGPLRARPVGLNLGQPGRVTCVAAQGDRLGLGLDSGAVVALDLTTEAQSIVRSAGDGAAVTALAVAADGRLAYGDETGGAGIVQV